MPEVIPHFVERANDIGTSDALQEFERSRTPNPQTPTSKSQTSSKDLPPGESPPSPQSDLG